MRAPRGREGLPRSPLFYETNSASSICPGQTSTSSFADGRRRGDRPLGGFASGFTFEGAGVVAGGRLLALAVHGFFSIRFLKPPRREVKVHDPVALARAIRDAARFRPRCPLPHRGMDGTREIRQIPRLTA